MKHIVSWITEIDIQGVDACYDNFLNLLLTKKILKFFLSYPLSLRLKLENLKA